MSVSAVVKNGEFVKSASETSMEKGGAKKASSAPQKEDFLQLLVAQMKFQDPLEPTDNTEWVSQYATFSELEQMQNMSGTMELTRASSLVGQTVIIETSDSSGNTVSVQGNVDYVSYENGKPYLSINGGLYALSDLSLVVDDDYLNAYKIAGQFIEDMQKLPKLTELTIDYKDMVKDLQERYNAMTAYQQSFVGDDNANLLEKYVQQMGLMTAEEEDE